MKDYEARFIVDDEVGPRGVELVGIQDGEALIKYFLPHVKPCATTEEYRAEQDTVYRCPPEWLHLTYEDARQAAIVRKRALMSASQEAENAA